MELTEIKAMVENGKLSLHPDALWRVHAEGVSEPEAMQAILSATHAVTQGMSTVITGGYVEGKPVSVGVIGAFVTWVKRL